MMPKCQSRPLHYLRADRCDILMREPQHRRGRQAFHKQQLAEALARKRRPGQATFHASRDADRTSPKDAGLRPHGRQGQDEHR